MGIPIGDNGVTICKSPENVSVLQSQTLEKQIMIQGGFV